jgi:uncharacterized protein DUF4234
MTDSTLPPPDPATAMTTPYPSVPPPPYGAVPVAAGPGGVAVAPFGQIRNTGTCFLLMVVTLGIYGWVWYFKTHEEMKRHTGTGLGGGIALLLGIFVGIVMPFLTSNEVGHLYERRGQKPPVSALTGLWALLLGWFFFVGIIVWFVKTNGALNAYWRSLGAR